MDLSYLAIFIWIGCFLLIAIDSSIKGISSVFWRLAGLVGGPFALIAYGIVREEAGKRKSR